MDNNKFFLIISRINSVLLLVLLVFGLIFLLFAYTEITNNTRRSAVEIPSLDNDNTKEIIELSDIENVSGQKQQIIKVYSKRGGEIKSGSYSRTYRNILFITPDSIKPQWLFPNNNMVIDRSTELNKYIDNKTITDFFYIEYFPDDKNKDKINVAICSTSGDNLNTIDENIKKVVNYKYFPDTKKLGILIQADNEIRYRVYDLSTSKRISDTFVIKLNQA